MIVVLDTNILVSGLRSRLGASYRLLQELDKNSFQIALSPALVLEYEEVLLRNNTIFGLSAEDITLFLDILCARALHTTMFYLWRPQLSDPDDELVLETAINAQAFAIITYNRRDFAGSERFGIQILTPQQFIQILKEQL